MDNLTGCQHGVSMAGFSVHDSAHVDGAFPVDDLSFAMAWSRVAPGIGGWRLAVSEMTSGEIVEIIPPGAKFPVFYVLPRPGGAEIIWDCSTVVEDDQASLGLLPSLRDAVLLLCPLTSEVLAQVRESLGVPG